MRLRTRIFLTLAGVLALSFAVVAWWTETGLESRLTGLAAGELERSARLLVDRAGEAPFSDSLADGLGEVAGLRVTLIDPRGRVLGDSEVPAARLPRLESHAERPEVRAALAGRVGRARRESATAARRLVYVALPHPQGVLRVAVPVDALDETLVGARRLELLGILLGLALAFVLSRWLAATVARPLAQMRRAVEAYGRGGEPIRVPVERAGSVGALARAIQGLGDRLQGEVGALRGEKEDLEALFESLDDGLAVVDAEGMVVRANPAFARWAGRSVVIGQRFGTLFRSPQMLESVERARQRASESQEFTLGDRTVLMSVQPHRGGALVVLRDLTRLRKLEGVRRDFVSNVSHELKTPLTSLLGFAEAIGAGDLTPEHSADFGRRIVANAQRMRRLVDDLLDLAYVESGGWTPRPRTVRIEPLARSAWGALESLPEEKGLALRVEASETPVHADPEAVRQVLRNLFDNALRYAPEGSEVTVHTLEEGPMLRVSVRDTGPGIPSAHHGRIFERFYRVDPARSREEGGTGLGLSIVKHLVGGHGGAVGVESAVGLGTTIWFTLPIAADPAA